MLIPEAFVPRFDRVAERNAVDLMRQELEKARNVVAVEMTPAGDPVAAPKVAVALRSIRSAKRTS